MYIRARLSVKILHGLTTAIGRLPIMSFVYFVSIY